MNMPSLQTAEALLAEAAQLNPGPWIEHSRNTAQAARLIASQDPRLDPDTAYLFGYLHDIGRREGVTYIRHILDGYNYLCAMGYSEPARMCMARSCPYPCVDAYLGERDCAPAGLDFINQYIKGVCYTPYDRLIQLCDSLALPDGFCLIEKRLVDVALRYGTNSHTVLKWKAVFAVQAEFEAVIGGSIYSLLDGVIENTFRL